MAFHDFWNKVRIGAKLYAPGFIAEAPPLDADAIEDMLRKTTHWVTPRSVAGFDETRLLVPARQRAGATGETRGGFPSGDRDRQPVRAGNGRHRGTGAALVPGHHSAARIRPLRRRRGLPVGEADRTGDCPLEAARTCGAPIPTRGWTTPATRASGSGRISRTRSPRRMRTSWKRLEGSEVLSKTSPDRLPPIAFPTFRSARSRSSPSPWRPDESPR